jgi:hypothetical protein
MTEPKHRLGASSCVPLSKQRKRPAPKTIHHLYDLATAGDHVIKLERWFDKTPTAGLPLLLGAVDRCPSEDAGRPASYTDCVEAISDPPIRTRKIYASGTRAVRSERHRSGGARRRCIVGKMKAAPVHTALKQAE